MEILIKVPVSAHVKQFLVSHYGSDIVSLKLSDFISQFFHSMLSKPDGRYQPRQNSKIYSQSFTYILDEDDARRRGLDLNDTSIMRFNNFVDHMIKFGMWHYVEGQQKAGVKIKKSIYEYSDKYDLLENGVTFENLKKNHFRYRKKNIKKPVANLSPAQLSVNS